MARARIGLQGEQSIGDAVLGVHRILASVGIDESRLEAELLLCHVLGIDRTHLFLRWAESLGGDAAPKLLALVERRLQREPLSYLTGWRWFYNLRLAARPGVLIPRPETEVLVEEAIRLGKERYAGSPLIADVGCGSGAIAVALAVNLPGARIYALDASAVALAVTRGNCELHDVLGNVQSLEGDLLSPLPEAVDIVACNLPYLRSGQFSRLQPEVQYEPREALDGGPDGLTVIMRMLDQLPGKLKLGGAVLVECDPRQVKRLGRCIGSLFPHATIRVLRDLARRERVVEVLL